MRTALIPSKPMHYGEVLNKISLGILVDREINCWGNELAYLVYRIEAAG